MFSQFFSYSQYSIISEADRVITFGGHCHYQSPYELDEVTEYKNDEWTLLGTGFQRSSDYTRTVPPAVPSILESGILY